MGLDSQRSTDEKIGRTVRGIGTGLWALGALAFNAMLVSVLFIPAAREHCVSSGQQPGTLQIDSGWTFGVPPFIFEDTLEEEQACIRNSPGREILSAVGIWPLGTPEEQFEDKLKDAGAAIDGDSGRAFVESLLELKEEAEIPLTRFERDLNRANGPGDVEAAFSELATAQRSIARRTSALGKPPKELRDVVRITIEGNLDSADAADRVVSELENGNEDSIQEALLAFDRVQADYAKELGFDP